MIKKKYLLLLLLLLLLYFYILKNKKKTIPDVKWPFINLKDENNNNINLLCVRSYLDNEEDMNTFLDYINKGYKFIGCSSYLSYPSLCNNIHGNCHFKRK